MSEYPHSVKTDPVEVHESDHGLGVFAKRAMVAGSRVMRFTGPSVTFKDTLALGAQESFALQVGSDAYLLTEPPLRYVNHSCDPNCGVDADQYLVTMRDVKAGEELTYDYSTTMLERHWQMHCACGSNQCRRLIQDFDLLPPELMAYYIKLGLVQPFIVASLSNGLNPVNNGGAQPEKKVQ
jgi:hypothetical protein